MCPPFCWRVPRVNFWAMLTAITREVSSAMAECELTFMSRQPIDLFRARQQHHEYQAALEKLGARVLSLPQEPHLPDSMFVEDPALVLDELAVIMRLGTESRRAEAESLAQHLGGFRPLQYISAPGTLEGGDILRVGKTLFAGLSKRSNLEGIRQLQKFVAPHGYQVVSVEVRGCLHLKSAVTFLGGETLLANRAWFDSAPFSGFQWLDVASDEAHAANALTIGKTTLFPSSFPRTRAAIKKSGFAVTALDISELQKAESGLTCSSLLFVTE